MNKRDKMRMANIIAEFEWGTAGGSSSEAAAFGHCARVLRESFDIPADDLNFAYAWAILQRATSATPTDDHIDGLINFIEVDGYEAVIDFIEENRIEAIVARIEATQ